jgi:broad specificity phosphatase PhoE
MNRQSVLGNIPEAENFAEFQRRVLDWFDNEFFQKYKDAPIPTVIIADAMVLGTIVYHLMNRAPYAVAKDVVMQLKPGAAVEFKSDGMHLQYSRVL